MTGLTEERSMADFQANIDRYAGELKRTKTPIVLTKDGQPELVVQDAASYQEILDRLEDAETMAALQRGMDDVENGRVMPLEEAEAKLRAKYGF